MKNGGPRRTSTKKCIGVFLVAALCCLLVGCRTTIVPPNASPPMVEVCIVDYGRHASLVLPDNGGSVEFEYGEWKWFALGHDQSPQVFSTLFRRTPATLGRRELADGPGSPLLKEDSVEPVQERHVFPVPEAKAARLKRQLETRYHAASQTEVFNEEYGMTFVKDDSDYSLLHNCNHELAKWLQQLGCEVKGFRMFSRFRVKMPAKRER